MLHKGILEENEFNIEKILERKIRTGGSLRESLDDYLFTCISLTEKEFEYINNTIGIDMFALRNDIDFVTVQYEGEINFKHYSNPDNEDSILSLGLLVSEDEWVMDLGSGIYVIEDDDLTGQDNLCTYFEEKEDNEEVLVVTGTYSGPYEECVYGIGHEHYIVIPKTISPDNLDTDISTYGDEFFY